MERKRPSQPLELQPVMPSAPPMPPADEATSYYWYTPQEPHSVDRLTAADDPPSYEDALQALHSMSYMTAPSAPSYHQQPVDLTQQAMHGYSNPLSHQPTAGHQGKEVSQRWWTLLGY